MSSLHFPPGVLRNPGQSISVCCGKTGSSDFCAAQGFFAFQNQFSTSYFGFPAFFSEFYLDLTHSGYYYTHP